MTTQQPSVAESHVTKQIPQPFPASENTIMPFHEALEYMGPDDKIPHDVYAIFLDRLTKRNIQKL